MHPFSLIIEDGIFIDTFHFRERVISVLKRKDRISFQMLRVNGFIAIQLIRAFIFDNGIYQILYFHKSKTVFFIVYNEFLSNAHCVFFPCFTPYHTLQARGIVIRPPKSKEVCYLFEPIGVGGDINI